MKLPTALHTFSKNPTHSVTLNYSAVQVTVRAELTFSSCYTAVFWIENENDVDNTVMFCFLLNCAYPKPKTFFPLHISCSARKKKNKLGGSIARKSDLKGPNGYSTVENIILVYKVGRVT